MLDANQTRLTKAGTVAIDGEWVRVEGFAAERGSCRDVSALAIVWAIGRLQNELMKTLERPGGGNVCID